MNEKRQALLNSIGMRGRLDADIRDHERSELAWLVHKDYAVPDTVENRESATDGIAQEGLPE